MRRCRGASAVDDAAGETDEDASMPRRSRRRTAGQGAESSDTIITNARGTTLSRLAMPPRLAILLTTSAFPTIDAGAMLPAPLLSLCAGLGLPISIMIGGGCCPRVLTRPLRR